MDHGWADALVTPQNDIDYFLRLAGTQGRSAAAGSAGLSGTQSFFRLFMAPGMVIASAAPGPNVFGDQTKPPAMTRPLCVFPEVARYNGSGPTDVADNFTCVDDHATDNPMTAPKYHQ